MELVLFLVVLDVELSPSVAVSCLPILDIGVLMLSHHSLALHLLMQGVLCFGVHRCSDPGGGGVGLHPLPAQCTIAMATMLEAAWMRCWPCISPRASRGGLHGPGHHRGQSRGCSTLSSQSRCVCVQVWHLALFLRVGFN